MNGILKLEGIRFREMGDFKARMKYQIKISDVTDCAPNKLNSVELELDFLNSATPTPVPETKKPAKKK